MNPTLDDRGNRRGWNVCVTGAAWSAPPTSFTPGFSYLDQGSNNAGFDIDLCRAVGAAVLGDPSAVEFRIVSPAERGPVLQAGEIDILASNTTWTSSRDALWGNFAQVMFYSGQGFMVRSDTGIHSALELRGRQRVRNAGNDDGAEPSGLLNRVGPEHSGRHVRAHRRRP